MENALAIRLPIDAEPLPDTRDWQNRFEIRSESSDRLYVVAQHKDKRHWGCSCPAWRRWRHCKHLETVGLPCYEIPREVAFTR